MKKLLTWLRDFVNKYHIFIAFGIITVFFLLSFFTMKNDSAIVDEVAHIPAGYSYLKYGDYRLNPEHPPLLKDLAAAPLLALDLKFPDDSPAWYEQANGQWEVGWDFIYHYGNNADQILFFSRLPILILGLILAFAIYRFCLKRFGAPTALLTLILFAFSPNIIAHNHFVTTDLGIAAATFFAIWTFINWVNEPTNKKNFLLAGLFFGIAQVTKFSAIMLVPFFIGMVAIKIISLHKKGQLKKELSKYFLGLFGIFLLGFILVWLFYIPHTINMPLSMQDKLIKESLPGGYYNLYGGLLTTINKIPLFKPIAQYALGLLMVVNRVQSGNITYFLGDANNQSFALYFPVSFVLKTPLPMLIMIVVSVLAGIITYIKKKSFSPIKDMLGYCRDKYIELTFLLFIAFYSYLSITGNLNLGIRHLFPMMPFVFILVAKESFALYHKIKNYKYKAIYAAGLLLLTVWYVIISLVQYPKYVPYIESAFGGSANAYKYLSDSNVDWGQDAKRLVEYVNNNPNIDKIAVDYFGGADPKYYFCKREYNSAGELLTDPNNYDCSDSKFIEWHVNYGRPTTKYIAVSETYLMSDIYYKKSNPRQFDYQWLRDKTPVAKIGDSIYIYKVN
jgi:hypothetical protein